MAFKTETIEDNLQVQECDNCGKAYAVAYSEKLERWIFVCMNCGASCNTLVTEEGEEIEIR